MEKRYLFSLILLSILLVATVAGCAPAGGEEPAAAPPESSDEEGASGSGLATALPADADREPAATTTGEAQELDEAVENDEDAQSSEENEVDDERTQAESNEAVTPSVVDLSKVTPQPPSVDETPRVMPGPGIPNPSALVSNRAAVDLADTLDIDVSDIQIVSVEWVEWRDSSLGCPKPGQSYLTVITPGYRILLEANGQQYEYHTNEDGTILTQCTGGVENPSGVIDR